jgi:hypothetical protein
MFTKSKSFKLFLLPACALAQAALAADWQPLTGASTLRELVSGATAEITLTRGVTATGTYNADGTARIEAWNETGLYPVPWTLLAYSMDFTRFPGHF